MSAEDQKPTPFELWGIRGTVDPGLQGGEVVYGNFADGIAMMNERHQHRGAKDPVPASENPMGLTPGEQRVLDHLNDSYKAFLELDREHPDEIRDFVDAVHRIQDLMAVRIVRRVYPQGWPTFNDWREKQ